VDPGPHVVRAAAPGRMTWESTIDARAEHTTAVAIPALASTTPPEEGPPPLSDVAPRVSVAPLEPPPTQKTLGFVVGRAALAGLPFGGVATGLALSAKSDCTPYPDCGGTPGGRDANDRAHTWATVSTIAFVAGAALVVTGLVLVLTAPKAKSTALVPTPLPAIL